MPSNSPDPLLSDDAVYHLATPAEWEAAVERGELRPGSLASEGFVHCSRGRQVAGTRARHFQGVGGLLALEVDPDRLDGARLVHEDTAGVGEPFPHVYGPIPASAVIAVVPLD